MVAVALMLKPNLWRWNWWTLGAVFLAAIVSLPIIAVFGFAAQPAPDIWMHLLTTSFPFYLRNTFVLLIGVACLVALIGVSTAWLVSMCNFPGRQIFEWLLLLPLAFPAYVIAYAYTDLLEYAGPVQSLLRLHFEWSSPAEYWFPNLRSIGGAIILMAFVLYPYVYLLARSAFLTQSVSTLEISRALGRTSWQTFFLVSLPNARPAIVVGIALASMETLNDYGTVDFFSVPTLTAGIIDVWLGMGSLAAGAQIATMLVFFVVLLILFEKASRRNRRYYQQSSSRYKPLPTYSLNKWRGALAIVICGVPVVCGFLLPVLVLTRLSIIYFSESWTPHFQKLAANSLTVSGMAALLTVALALFISYSRRLQDGKIIQISTTFATLGYAIPGAVLAVGILTPLGFIDNAVDAFLQKHFNLSSGLLFSGTVAAVVFAYIVRFLTIAVGQIESSLGGVALTVDMAARTLGYSARSTMVRFHVPLISGGLFTALMIVFVDCMKELPATLILRPFGFETLATHVFYFASDEMLGQSALGSLTIVLVGVIPVVLLCHLVVRSRDKSPTRLR
ncbi:MAG: iron ABC transporter permease [Acidiferrobacteraceae bacterium]|nr:iron ABC transporter permease [Acidiferrobacteraceae bacterium]|tara:strand:+ start:613 stop:2298 length:1686 start_codon:yes stop_codon:yes gene_type:complete